MKVLLFAAVLVGILAFATSARKRTVRRGLSLRPHEKEVLHAFDKFQDQADKHLEPTCYDKEVGTEFALMRKTTVLDDVFKACIASETLWEDLEVTTRKKRELRSDLVKRLLKALKRQDAQPCDETITETDPSELMYDADIQFHNLCVTLFEIRRVNGNEPIYDTATPIMPTMP